MFKLNFTNKIYNLFNSFFYNNTKPDSIIEPLTCLIRLSIINFKPLNTKLSIYNNRITYDEPNILQGAMRWSNGDNREDIHNIFNPIRKAGEWFDLNNDNLKTIFKFSVKGLEKLKLSYNENSTIAHSIEYYILFLKNKINEKNEKNEKNTITTRNNKNNMNNTDNTDNTDNIESNSIYLKLKKLWNEREINIVNNILLQLEDNSNNNNITENEPLIIALETILEQKELHVKELLFKTVSTFNDD